MTDIQKEYCEEKGLVYIKPENTEVADYVCWLESQILAFVVGQREQFVCDKCKHPVEHDGEGEWCEKCQTYTYD